jgi:hypothetical protein
MASLPYAAAKLGPKAFSPSSKTPMDPHKVHLAPVPTLEDATEHRIIGGEVAESGEFPFYVLWLDEDVGFCGGSLIHEDIILTAAHCNPILADSVTIGAYFLQSFDANAETGLIENRMVHPNYNEETFVNDVMVLKITSPSSLPPIALNDDFSSPIDGENVVSIGLGQTDDGSPSEMLRKVTVPIVAHDQCAADHADIIVGGVVEDVMLCAGLEEGGKSACFGDSGGPLLELRGDKYIQVGINSWNDGECANPNSPGVYTRVSGVKSWIDQMICELSENPPASCGSSTPPPDGEGQCEDVQGWYDSDGPEYDCIWYEENDACEFASDYENDGYTATEACCVCGGGTSDGSTPTSPPPGEGQCEDVQGWYDSDGPEYDCTWYEENDACEFASEYENDGYTATEACCVCGGGTSDGSTPTPPPPGEGQCEDVHGWYDSEGPEYDCTWYEENEFCEFASEFENDGYAATEACCVCGGGNRDGSTPPSPPSDGSTPTPPPSNGSAPTPPPSDGSTPPPSPSDGSTPTTPPGDGSTPTPPPSN